MFYFNGISSEDMGVVANEEDFCIRASKEFEQFSVSGKNGSIYNEFGYSDVTCSMDLTILNNNIDDVFEWLNGKGILEFNNRIVEVMFYNQQEVKRISAIHSVKVDYIRRPFWHTAHDQYIKVQRYVSNDGNTISNPLIKMVGNGIATLSINGVSLKYNFDNENEVIIDCENKTEMFNGISKSKKIEIGFEYPFLNVGVNEIIFKNADVFIKNKDCWL